MLLVSMPNKFRKNVWVKRGDFVIIEPIDEGSKVRGEIANVLYKEQVKKKINWFCMVFLSFFLP